MEYHVALAAPRLSMEVNFGCDAVTSWQVSVGLSRYMYLAEKRVPKVGAGTGMKPVGMTRLRVAVSLLAAIGLPALAGVWAFAWPTAGSHETPAVARVLRASYPTEAHASQAAPPESTERPRIAGIAHVAFRTSDPAAARQFYGKVLGLAASREQPTTDRVHFRVNDRQAIIIEAGLPADTEERLSHLAFETADLEALATYLKAHSVAVETVSPPCAARALRVRDPDGHPIEFIQRVDTPATPSTRDLPGAASSAKAAAASRAAGAAHETSRATPALSVRVLHAGLTIRDTDAADRFYKAVLGFSEIWRGGRTDTVTSWINMKVPDGTDYLEYMLVSGPVSRQQLGVLHHVALLVPDIQAAYEAALRRTPADARTKLASPQVGRNNRWQLNLYDPDGTRVELMEPFTMR
jgi:catechol 2,3-dioxygenase-like lactoylglutathione lyase family enzyme